MPQKIKLDSKCYSKRCDRPFLLAPTTKRWLETIFVLVFHWPHVANFWYWISYITSKLCICRSENTRSTLEKLKKFSEVALRKIGSFHVAKKFLYYFPVFVCITSIYNNISRNKWFFLLFNVGWAQRNKTSSYSDSKI